MTRRHADWLAAFMEYCSHGEAPQYMYFWVGVSTIAGALRRKVWIDQAYFQWYPNFYIVLVGPPGIVSKTTTLSMGMNLLRKVPDIKFGPDVITWPALVDDFQASTMAFEYKGAYHPMSAMTLDSGEFGNLLNPQDREMVDLLVTLWDGKSGTFRKRTKTSGDNEVPNPWINLIACTTPSWIAGNFPEYLIGGGFTSRTIFVYADEKARLSAYPGLDVPVDFQSRAESLVADLCHIARLAGEYKLSPEAIDWGRAWYAHHNSQRHAHLDKDKFGGYLARKQTHIHKLGMILAAATSDELLITSEHLATAHTMVTDLEQDMQFVFSKIGRTDQSLAADKLIEYIHEHKKVPYSAALRHVHALFPSMRDFEDVLAGLLRAGYAMAQQHGNEVYLVAGRPLDKAGNGKPDARSS